MDEIIFAVRARNRRIEHALYHPSVYVWYYPASEGIWAETEYGDEVFERVSQTEDELEAIRAAVQRAAKRLVVRRILRGAC